MRRLIRLATTFIIAIFTNKALRRKLIRMAIGLMIAMLTDIASGLFIEHLFRKITGYSPSWIVLGVNLSYLRGPFLSLFPDLDAIGQFIGKKSVNAEHRTHLHTPLIVISGWLVFFALLSFLWSPAFVWWALLSALCLIAHSLHDSIGSGGGVRWAWPFSNEYYQLFSIRERRLFSVWKPTEWEYYGLEDWLERFFLKPTVESVTGVIAVVTAVILIVLW